MFMDGHVDRIILSRPAVEAGERLGFLPGDMKEKVDPYMQPLYDALNDFLPGKQAQRLIEEKRIEIAPLAFMRGRTLSNAFETGHHTRPDHRPLKFREHTEKLEHGAT